MKAIEPGALCLIVSSVVPENNGRCVTAVRFVGRPWGHQGEDWWLIDSLIINTKGERIPYIPACRLLRIDGNPDTVEREEKEKIKVFY